MEKLFDKNRDSLTLYHNGNAFYLKEISHDQFEATYPYQPDMGPIQFLDPRPLPHVHPGTIRFRSIRIGNKYYCCDIPEFRRIESKKEEKRRFILEEFHKSILGPRLRELLDVLMERDEFIESILPELNLNVSEAKEVKESYNKKIKEILNL